MGFKQIRLLAPIAFWIFQVIIYVIRNIYIIGERPLNTILFPMVVTFPLDIVTFLIFYFLIGPGLNLPGQRYKYIFLTILYIGLYGFVWMATYYLVYDLKDIDKLFGFYFSSMGHSLLYGFYGIVFRLAIDWFENREKQKELERDQVKTELAMLRSQVNPHFLFNTLNNIHSFSSRDADKTSFAIIKLSEIMRYMLYEAREERVLVSKEIQYIENYLALQKLRYKTTDFVRFDYRSDYNDLLIPSMLFIPFIENAFKHGRKTAADDIVISLTVKENEILFYCNNRIRKLNETEKDAEGGIGLVNIKRRLELLYSKKHHLSIDSVNDTFSVKLNINLNED